jgi:hypothetical protein
LIGAAARFRHAQADKMEEPMEGIHHPEHWEGLYVVIGTSAGALVGLLFIVMSLHFAEIRGRTDDNMRLTIEGGRNNTYHLLTVLIEAALVLTPQPIAFLGAELVLINLFGLRLPLTIVYKYARRPITISERGGFPTHLIATIIVAYLTGAVAGGLLIAGHQWALYLVTAACLVKLVRAVLTAWMLMFGMVHAEAAAEPEKAG